MPRIAPASSPRALVRASLLVCLLAVPALARDAESGAGEPTVVSVPIGTPPIETAQAAGSETGSEAGPDAEGSDASRDAGAPLRVGIVPRPPYAMPTEAGWTGLAVEAWQFVAQREGLAYAFVPLERGTGVDAVASGAVDLALPLDATGEAATRVAFTAPLHTATIGVAGGRRTTPLDVVARLLTWDLARIVIGLSVLLFVVGAVVWWLERRRNEEMFGGTTTEGLGDGFWWAGVTLTTIGYGDKAPVTMAGRAVAMVWMLVGLAISSALTAAVVSATGIGRGVSLPEDLRGLTVLAEADTAAARFLGASDIAFTGTSDVDGALRAVRAGEADAFVGLAPMIAERVKTLDLDVPVNRSEREPHLVSIARARDLPNGPAIDAAVIATVTVPAWGDAVARYLER